VKVDKGMRTGEFGGWGLRGWERGTLNAERLKLAERWGPKKWGTNGTQRRGWGGGAEGGTLNFER
jgi:hypothetical protein